MPRRIRFSADCRRQLKESPSIDLTSGGAPLEARQKALLLLIAFARHCQHLSLSSYGSRYASAPLADRQSGPCFGALSSGTLFFEKETRVGDE
jgi:hypothetical protein